MVATGLNGRISLKTPNIKIDVATSAVMLKNSGNVIKISNHGGRNDNINIPKFVTQIALLTATKFPAFESKCR